MTDGTTSGNTLLSTADADALRGTAKWARFLAIVGFVMIGLMVLFGLFAGTMLATLMSKAGGMGQLQGMEGLEGADNMNAAMAMAGTMYSIIFLLMAALYLFPTLMLYQFATRTLKALAGPMDHGMLTSGLNSHRRLYKFMGILMIIVLSFYALVFLIAGLGVMMM